MTPAAGRAPADLGHRLEAFVLDRLAAWPSVTLAWWAVGAVPPAPGTAHVAVLALAVLLGAEVALAVPLGLRGVSPGRALRGVRLVDAATGRPPGLVPALARAGMLAASLLPSAGLGAAALGWTAALDPGGRRQAWHDRLTGTAVVAVAAPEVATPVPEPGPPPGLLNLTTRGLAPRGPAA